MDYIERDIDEHEREYDNFVEATGNDFIPAFMLIEHEGEDVKDVKLMAPDRDFDDIHEALEKGKTICIKKGGLRSPFFLYHHKVFHMVPFIPRVVHLLIDEI